MKATYHHLKRAKPTKRAPVHNELLSNVDLAISIMTRSRDSHFAWVRFFHDNPGSEEKYGRLVGNNAQHQRIISEYDLVLNALDNSRTLAMNQAHQQPVPISNTRPLTALEAFSQSLVDFERELVLHGGAGSGDYGHAGRPGERGGSEAGEGGGEAHGASEHGEHGGHGEHESLGHELFEHFESGHEHLELLHEANFGGVLGSKLRGKVEGVVKRVIPKVAEFQRKRMEAMEGRYGKTGMAYLEVAASGAQMALNLGLSHGVAGVIEKGGEHLLHKMAHKLGEHAVSAAVESAGGTLGHMTPFVKFGLLMAGDAALRTLSLGHLNKESKAAPVLKTIHQALLHKTGLSKVGHALAHGIGYVKSGVGKVVKGAGEAYGEFAKGLGESVAGFSTHDVRGATVNAKAQSQLTYAQIEKLPDDAKLPGSEMTAGQLRKEVENLYVGIADQVGRELRNDADFKDAMRDPESRKRIEQAMDSIAKRKGSV